jgi:hypothetical protein
VNPPRLLALVVIASSAVFCVPRLLAQTWDFSQAVEFQDVIEIPDETGTNALSFKGGGAKRADDPDAPGGKVVQFDGTQTSPAFTRRTIDPLRSLEIKVRFKPLDQGPPLQTLVSLNAAYELRINREKNQLEFIVLSVADKKYHVLRGEHMSDVWNVATATYRDGKLTLRVGLSLKDGELPAGFAFTPQPARMQVSSNMPASRQFVGSISELSVATP